MCLTRRSCLANHSNSKVQLFKKRARSLVLKRIFILCARAPMEATEEEEEAAAGGESPEWLPGWLAAWLLALVISNYLAAAWRRRERARVEAMCSQSVRPSVRSVSRVE